MEIIENTENGITAFKIAGRLDSKTSDAFDRRLSETLENGVRHVLVDCSELAYISSAGLRVFIKAAKYLQRVGEGAIVLCAMEDYVREVFEIAGFDSFIPITQTCEQGRDRLRRPE
jgi:anti-sigma B factor antagonist